MVSPACAGMIPWQFTTTKAVPGEPRMRGDDPDAMDVLHAVHS